MIRKTTSRIFALALAGFASVSTCHAAQPDYTNAIWRSAYPGHWYTTGVHAFVVVHDMEGYYAAVISYFQNSNTQASAHYLVNGLKDNASDYPAGEITQMVEERYWAWHVRCWNRYMFGIEHEGFVSNPAWYTEDMYQASGALTRYLCSRYGIARDRNHIIGHNEWQNATWRTWMTNNWPAIDPTCNDHTDPGAYWNWSHYMAIISDASAVGIQPWSLAVDRGSNATFKVTATGASPLAYQWKKNGANIAGATSSTYSVASVQPANAGNFSVVITNTFGAVTSRVASLSVNPAWVQAFADSFEANSAANWNLFWGAGNGVAEYTTNWAFDYSTTKYVASGVTNFIPPAPNSGGTTRGLKITVNKNDTTAATAGVSVYPKSLTLSNDYSLRFDVWINYNGGPGGGTGSTEYMTCGLNHTGSRVNWTTSATSSDGFWFAVDGEGGSGGSDYRTYLGNGAAPTQLSFATSGLAASGAGSDNVSDPFYQSLFPTPTYESAGVPGKRWVQVELSQINNVITWQLNGTVVAQRTNTSPYTSGDVMIGYMDPYTSIANPLADNFVIFDNVRVLVAAAEPAITAQPQSQSVKAGTNVTFTVSASGTAPLNYQWRFNGTNLAGATGESFTRVNVQTNDAGNYSVVVTNVAGVAPSSDAILTVTPLLPLRFELVAALPDGRAGLILSGEPGSYLIETSTNLTNWLPLTSLSNSNGTFEFIDDAATNDAVRFYRASPAP